MSIRKNVFSKNAIPIRTVALLFCVFFSAAGCGGASDGGTSDVNTDINAGVNSDSEISEKDSGMKIVIRNNRFEIVYRLNESVAARELSAQLPLNVTVEPFSDNEMTFYPPEKLNTTGAPLSGGKVGSLSYYAPWGDVVMFYAPCSPNGSLYELGTAVSGTENIDKLTGNVTVSVAE